MTAAFGLDFGTTNSSLSAVLNGVVQLVDVEDAPGPEKDLNRKLLKSVLYFEDEYRVFIGQAAIDQYLKKDIDGRYMQSIKSYLPNIHYNYTSFPDKDFGLDELISIILKKMKTEGEVFLGQEVENVVLGRPVFFDKDPAIDALAQKRLQSAALLAGFRNIHFQMEPVAAALAYESSLKKGEEKVVFVGDLGGGTSDFSIIRLKGGRPRSGRDRNRDILAVGGVYIGGDRFDSDIMWERLAPYFGKEVVVEDFLGKTWLPMPAFIYKLRHWHQIPQLKDVRIQERLKDLKYRANDPRPIERLERLIDENYGLLLFQEIEKAKKELSSSLTSIISFQENTYFRGMDELIHIDELLTREEFEQIIEEDVSKINRCIDQVIEDSELTPDRIDHVFLTGGSSYVPMIKKGFQQRFGGEKLVQSDAFTSVAFGLGIYAASLYND
ncbi:MAG: Hsp70 family protein [Thermodesulfobacteriota bacterium]